MRLIAVNTDQDQTNYHALRHLFDAAAQISLLDYRWHISPKTFTSVEKATKFTEYRHASTGHTIGCKLFGYTGDDFMECMYIFTTDDGESNQEEIK